MRRYSPRQRRGEPPANGAAPRRKLVIVFEDHASVGGLIAGLLRREGYRVMRAWGHPELLRIARDRKPDAVVLDLNLASPEISTSLQELRATEGTRKAALVAVAPSGVAFQVEDRELLLELVEKPYDIDVMLNAVRAAVGDPQVQVPPRRYSGQDAFLHGY